MNRASIKNIIFFLSLFPFLANTGYAQIENNQFEHLTREDGLSHSKINCIAQDNQGFIWIGTDNGLNRYDGYSFRVFHHSRNNPNSLSSSYIDDIIVDNNGSLWIAPRYGCINRFDPRTETFTHLHCTTLYDSIINEETNFSALDMFPSGDIITCGETGIYIIKKNTNEIQYLGAGKKNYSAVGIQDLVIENDNSVWIVSMNKLIHLIIDKDELVTYKLPSSKSGDVNVKCINFINKDTIAIGTEQHGLLLFNTTNKTFIKKKYLAELHNFSDIIYAIESIHPDTFAVGTAIGLFVIQDKQIKHYSASSRYSYNLNNNNTSCIFIDKEKRFWIGTYGGLNIYDPLKSKFRHFKEKLVSDATKKTEIISAVYEDNGYVETTLPDGLNSLTFTTQTEAGASPVMARMEVFIDGVSQGEFEPSATDVATQFTIDNINKTGNVVVRFDGNGYEEVWLDDISWIDNKSKARTKISTQTAIRMYPNPLSNSNLTINLGAKTHANILIYDVNGKTIYTKECNSNIMTVDKNKFKKGMYLVRIITGNEVKTSKLIVE